MNRSRMAYWWVANLVAFSLGWPALAAEDVPMSIKKITMSAAHEVVVTLEPNGSVAAIPHLLDLPGPNHRLVLDFVGANIDQLTVLPSEALSAQASKAFPLVKSIRYSNLAHTVKPTARIVLDLPENLHLHPSVTKVTESEVVVALSTTVASGFDIAIPPADNAPANDNKLTDTKPSAESNVAVAVPSLPGAKKPATGMQPTVTTPAPTVSNANPATDNFAAESTAPFWKEDSLSSTNNDTAHDTNKIPIPGSSSATKPTPLVKESSAAGFKSTANVSSQTGQNGLNTATSATVNNTVALSAVAVAKPDVKPTTVVETSSALVPNSRAEAIKQYNAAVRHHMDGKLTEATAEYQAALAANPQLGDAYSNLGLIYNQEHNYGQAIIEFHKALDINPKDAITYNGTGAALRAQGDLTGAIKNWEKAVALDPKLATAYYNLGTAYEIHKELDKALDSYKLALKCDSKLGEAYYRCGLIMERQKRADDAIHEFEQALKISKTAEYSEDARQRLAFLNANKKK